MTVTINGTTGINTPGVVNTGNETISGTLNAGASTVTTLTSGNTFGFKNRLINGGCQVGQRGAVVFSTTNNLYGWVDRWLVSISGTTVSALGYQASGQPTATGYVLQVGNVTTTGTTTVAVSQRIESLNCADLNSATITFSCQVKQVTGSAQTLTLTLLKANAVDNFNGGTTAISSTTQSIPNNAYTTVSWTVTLGSTDASNGISISLAFNSLSAQPNTQFYYGDLQLEKGSVATGFDYRPYGTELMLCQRYTWVVNSAATSGATVALGLAYTGAANSCPLQYPIPMRASPTITFSAGTDFTATNGSGANIASTSMSTYGTNSSAAEIQATVASGFTVGQASILRSANANARIYISAEL